MIREKKVLNRLSHGNMNTLRILLLEALGHCTKTNKKRIAFFVPTKSSFEKGNDAYDSFVNLFDKIKPKSGKVVAETLKKRKAFTMDDGTSIKLESCQQSFPLSNDVVIAWNLSPKDIKKIEGSPTSQYTDLLIAKPWIQDDYDFLIGDGYKNI